MQPVGELHQQHPDVVAERQQELAEVLGGAFVLRLRLDLAELGDSVDQPGDVLAEQLLDLVRGRQRVLDRVVEDRGGDRLVVELEIGEDARDLDRMAEIRVARGALLVAVRLHREDVGAVDQPLVRIGIVGADLLDQLILPQHAPKMGAMRRYCASAKGWGRRGGSGDAQPRGGLLGGERLGRRGLAAALHLSSSAGVKARPSTRKLSTLPARLRERLAEDGRAALVGRALAGVGAAGPDDIAGDECARVVGAASLAE